MNIAYYISSHGFGHGVRATEICNRLPRRVIPHFRTSLPRSFFEEEMTRPFFYHGVEFDCGCIQKDGLTVDWPATFRKYMAIADTNRTRLTSEVEWCVANQIQLIISDIVPFAFQIANTAGIQSLAIANFTWRDIYRPHLSPIFLPYFEELTAQYHLATKALALYPAFPMTCFSNPTPVPIVGRVGQNIRSELTVRYKIPPEYRIGLIYPSGYGMKGVHWDRLAHLTGWHFIGIYPLPGAPVNFSRIPKTAFRYPDMTASVDLVISKLGYGTVAESLLNGTPLAYLPRDDFAEFPILEDAVNAWGYGYRLTKENFYALNWVDILARITDNPPQVQSNGVTQCVDTIINMIPK